jgi:putative ABC transport system permease protein
LASRNLFHDKVRLVVTLTGIVFAIILIVVQMALFIGFTGTTSGVIDHSGVDIWVAYKGVPFFEAAIPFSERKLYELLSVPGVANAEKLFVRAGNWKRADGVEQQIILVGFDPVSQYGGPWNVVQGDVHGLTAADTVFIDRLSREKLGVGDVGATSEINGHRARVVGFTNRIRSFTTQPYVFTSYKNAVRYAGGRDDQAVYVLVKVGEHAEVQDVKRAIAARVDGVDVYATPEFSMRQRVYWMFTTGAGFGILIAALMGLIVGVVVVSQTIYAATMDHIREFGTLKAIGASNGYLRGVLLRQAVMSAVIGYAIGIGASYALVWFGRDSTVALLLPWQLSASMLILTVGMCGVASLLSISKVMRLEPGMVFK